MKLPPLLFALTSRGVSGAVLLSLDGPVEDVRLELEKGWIHAIGRPYASAARPEDALRGILKRPQRGPAELLPDEPPTRRGRCVPFQPAVVLRNHVESQLPTDAGVLLRARAGEGALRLLFAPHASCLGADERPLVALLATPRGLGDLERAGVARPPRVLRLCAFLEAAGALLVESEGAGAYELLGLSIGAGAGEIRRTYKRLARALHPDLHPTASSDERRHLEERFAALNAAYRQLLPE